MSDPKSYPIPEREDLFDRPNPGYEKYPDVWELSKALIKECCCGGQGWIRLPVPLGSKWFGKAIPCICTRDRKAILDATRLQDWTGMAESELQAMGFDAFDAESPVIPEKPARKRLDDPELSNQEWMEQVIKSTVHAKLVCQRYAANPKGWLLIVGGVGTGKTHLLYATVGALLQRGVPVYADTMPDLLDKLRDSISSHKVQAVIETASTVNVLALDDFGVEQATPFALEKTYQILNARWLHTRPTIISSNNLPTAANTEARLASRLNQAYKLTMICGDYRARAQFRG